jgi:hypothetical protein
LDSDFFGKEIEPWLLILQGEGDRQWLRVFYLENDIQPLGKIKTVVPEAPDGANNLLDACIAFFPEWFKESKVLQTMKKELSQTEFLDLNLKMPTDCMTLPFESLSQ